MTLSVAFPAVPVKPVRADDDIRVVVVDDAIVVRSLLTRWIEEVPGLRLVGAFRDGQEAVDRIGDLKPDVVVLDVEMPNLDGISALPLLLKKKRDLVVIMASALTREHAEITLKALALGAADYVPKPDAEGAIMTSANFQRELIEKILALGARRPRAAAPSPRRPTSRSSSISFSRATSVDRASTCMPVGTRRNLAIPSIRAAAPPVPSGRSA